MYNFIKGDIFEVGANILVNPVNCVGVMGKGLALQFKQKYPQMYVEYRNICNRNMLSIGKMHIWENNDITIINFPTKIHWRDKSKYEYISRGLDFLCNLFIGEQNIIKDDDIIAIPPLGCGLGGLDWNKVKTIIEDKLQPFKDLKAKILILEP